MSIKKILVVAAHPDDEVLGCGGTMAWHSRRQQEVHLMVMADGVTSRNYDPDNKVSRDEELSINRASVEKRKGETARAMNILDVSKNNIYHLDLADQRLDGYIFLDLVKKIEGIKKKVQPDIVYTHFWNDLNLDHRITTKAVYTAFRPKPQQKEVSIYQFEVPESTYLSIPDGKDAFRPNYFVDISETFELKLTALRAYGSEVREYPDLRSATFIKELARMRGGPKQMQYCEAFVELKTRYTIGQMEFFSVNFRQ